MRLKCFDFPFAEKSSGSKIKKKPSFRDDIKAMIKRRPSAPSQSPKSKSKSLNRTHSLNEGSKVDKLDKEDVSVLFLQFYLFFHQVLK